MPYIRGSFLLRAFYLLEQTSEKEIMEYIDNNYKSIIENVNPDENVLYFYPIYFLRRIIYTFVLVVLYDQPFIQTILIIALIQIPVFL